jgi:hypothetical protein
VLAATGQADANIDDAVSAEAFSACLADPDSFMV